MENNPCKKSPHGEHFRVPCEKSKASSGFECLYCGEAMDEPEEKKPDWKHEPFEGREGP